MTISNSTVYGNTAEYGGGILNEHNLNIINSIVAHNNAHAGPDIFGKVVSFGHNLIGDGSNSSFSSDYQATATAIAAHPNLLDQGTVVAIQNRIASMTLASYVTATITPLPPGLTPTATITPYPIMQNASTDQVGTADSPIDPKLNMAVANSSGNTPNIPLYTLLTGSPAIGHGDCSGNSSANPPCTRCHNRSAGEAAWQSVQYRCLRGIIYPSYASYERKNN